MAKATKARKSVRLVWVPKAPRHKTRHRRQGWQGGGGHQHGKVEVVTNKALAAELSKLLAERQQAARDLTTILKEAGFDVVAGSTTGHWLVSGSVTKDTCSGELSPL